MQVVRMKVAPDTVAYADGEHHKLIVEFAIPGAPTETIDLKLLEDSVHLLAPARDIEYVSALALGWPVKPDKAEAIYENGLLRMVKSFSSCKSLKALVSSASGYATASSFVVGIVSARNWASCRSIAAVIGMPRHSFDAAIRLA